jgi:2-keto-4-pentenoate hydratase/2-oxohepta-3-ene-1,7-dioic acid hydratase in catechol pathway
MRFGIATILHQSQKRCAVVSDGLVYPVPGRSSFSDLLLDWSAAVPRLEQQFEAGALEDPLPEGEIQFEPPVSPPNLYMIGANYADHTREMQGLAADEPVVKPPEGPFVFLKPTTALVGHRGSVPMPLDYSRVDWELELALVIGRRTYRATPEDALAGVAGYTVANDISVRDAFRRQDGSEPPMVWDWFAQKGWMGSCPCGPAVVPAESVSIDDLELKLTVNGEIEQHSRTSQMVFSPAEIIAYISGFVPLLPGDMICTGTCAGVGMAKGRYLSAGDVVTAEIENIGSLVSTAVAGSEAEQLISSAATL